MKKLWERKKGVLINEIIDENTQLECSGDVDGNGVVDIVDIISLINLILD